MIMLPANEVRDYGHWMIVTHQDTNGKSHRYSAHPTGVIGNRYDVDGEWAAMHESYMPYVTDYQNDGEVRRFATKAEAKEWMSA